MIKISVVATIRAAFTFTYHHLGSIIGLIWLPMVIVSVMGFFTLQNFFGAMIDWQGGSNPATLGPASLMMLAYLAISLLLYAVMYSVVTQLALGTKQGGAIVHFALGAAEWRLFRSLLALAGVMFVLMMGAMLLVSLITVAAGAAGTKLSAGQSNLLMMGSFYAVLAIAIPRFFIPLPAVAVSETVPALRRAWALSAGNFLPLLVIALAAFAPGLLIMQIADFVLTSTGHAAVPLGEQAQTIALFQRERAAMPIVSGLAFFVAPLTIGLVAGASVSVWRALTPATQDPMKIN